eukprot:6107679-Pleurochrysis_carterae.AAC.3
MEPELHQRDLARWGHDRQSQRQEFVEPRHNVLPVRRSESRHKPCCSRRSGKKRVRQVGSVNPKAGQVVKAKNRLSPLP